MKRVLTAAVLVPVVLLAVFRAPSQLFFLLVAIAALLTTREYLDIAAAHGPRPFRKSTYIFVFLFLCCFLFASGDLTLRFGDDASLNWLNTSFAVMTAAAFWFLLMAMRKEDLAESLPAAAMSLMGVLYLGFGYGALLRIRSVPWGKFLLLYLMLVVWTGDVAAYYFGRAFGKRKLAPRISPGKTWEGAIASLIAGIVVGVLLFIYAGHVASFLTRIHLLRPEDAQPSPAVLSPGIWVAFALSALINIAAQFGDLAESAIKRGAGVKDSGTILPGHGGLLDRVDALLFAAPVLCYYAVLFIS